MELGNTGRLDEATHEAQALLEQAGHDDQASLLIGAIAS
jgi:hypothetical protein